jgi:hypothetical protein
MNIPPPPPPSASKRSSKTMIIALVVVLAVAVAVGAYYVTTLPHDNNPGPEPSPTISSSTSSSPSTSPQTSASPLSTPSATVTPNPSGIVSVGYRDGAWANYTTYNYNASGGVTALYNMRYTINQGTLKGVDCWILQTDTQLSSGSSVMNTITTYWLDKSSLQGLHYKIVISSNGAVISDTENDYSPGDVNNIPTAINSNMVLSQESITVPAGTFNCEKAATTMVDLGKTYVTTVWGNSNVPIIGMVKQQMTQDGVLISSTELMSYGG